MKRRLTIFSLVLAILCAFGAIGVTNYNSRLREPVVASQQVAVYKQGNKGETVKLIQTKLIRWGYLKGTADGIFGPKTKEAVKYFQRKNGLTADGIVGNKTLKALGISVTSSSSSNAGYSDNDVYILAKAIYAEARGESYTGQVAVGAVILNRVKSSQFPNTITGVIYQPYAFTAVADGQINLEPNQTAKNAARDAINGWDPSYGALYYYNPKTATSEWIFSRTTIVTIGRHVFAI